MKVAVIAPLGMSPPVITAFVHHIRDVRDLVVITTADDRVKQGFELVKVAMKVKYPKTRVHEVEVPFEDITTEEQNFEFMRIAGRTIKRQKEKFGSDVVYLNVAGGRKNMCITLSILGQFLNVDGVFHVVSPNVKIVNEMLENLRHDIERLYLAESDEERLRIYEEKARYFNALMFPEDYQVVRIPTVPVPGDYMQRILDVIYNDRLDTLTYSERELLLRHGLIEKFGNRYRVSDFGKRFAEVLVG
ncbi:CRISPR-associated protein, Csx14 family [Geoglobus ahangari]|uniref:CRISPR-associated protein, Csx14 family n=1 Tax=Geoglobus ahangari TaxID=113653 RepID=A0A0F7DBL9_9EURY|nr:CRISPR-associated protein Csx14 [Geoglobus ahangari]AKG91321.1 CRISPR-associated protein, Csx14 family [Geoglobus ahangari]